MKIKNVEDGFATVDHDEDFGVSVYIAVMHTADWGVARIVVIGDERDTTADYLELVPELRDHWLNDDGWEQIPDPYSEGIDARQAWRRQFVEESSIATVIIERHGLLTTKKLTG